MARSTRTRNARLWLALSAAVAVGFLPGWPFLHLDEPVHWGVLGFLLVALLLGRGHRVGRALGPRRRRLVRLFLLALPVVYVASWLRFPAGEAALGVELVGLGIWLGLAWYGGRSDRVLWAGCALHALWDAAHFQRASFVPDWYVAACVAADLGVAGFVLLSLHGHSSVQED